MEPIRETGDDRIMWKIRPTYHDRPFGAWAICETAADAVDMIDTDGGKYEIEKFTMTAEAWNALPEFEGW